MSYQSGLSATLELRVRYAETDQMGVVHHANYFVWFEASRAELCRVHGIDYRQMEAEGLFLPVVEASARFVAPARYDDLIHIHVEIVERTRRTLRMEYRVERDGQSLATGKTYQFLMDAQSKPKTFPSDWAAKFGG